jgi:DNA-directed RNA polymerase subunit omega
MLLEPTLDRLIGGADTRYMMCIMAGKRARQLIAGGRKKIVGGSDRPVTAALEEMVAGVLHVERLKGFLR